MRVNGDAGGYVKGVAQYYVGSFASNAGELNEGFQVSGDSAGKVFYQDAAAFANAFCFVSKKAGGPDGRFQLLQAGLGKRLGCGITKEKFGGYLIDPFIGALCREYGGDHQFQWIAEIESTPGVRVMLIQQPKNGHDPAGRCQLSVWSGLPGRHFNKFPRFAVHISLVGLVNALPPVGLYLTKLSLDFNKKPFI